MNFNEFLATGAKCSHAYVSGIDGVKLFQVHFQPKTPSPYPPVIFIAGWGSVIDSWKIVLKEMTKDFEVFYLETREKSSSIHFSKQELSIESLGNDLPYVLSENSLINKPYTMFGSSLGATVILDAISKNKLSPTNVILIGPNAEFNIPLIWLLITRFTPAFFFYLLKPVVKWYMKKKYLDIESDPKQYDKYAHALNEANPKRLRRSALSFSSYKIWNQLSEIHQSVLIFTGSKDVMHDYDNTLQMAYKLSNCKLIDMKTNQKTHSIDMVMKMREFLNNN